jgi:hypothetical protein
LLQVRIFYDILRRNKRILEKERCPLFKEEENITLILLKCSETRKWSKQCLSSLWLNISEDVAEKIIIICTIAVE